MFAEDTSEAQSRSGSGQALAHESDADVSFEASSPAEPPPDLAAAEPDVREPVRKRVEKLRAQCKQFAGDDKARVLAWAIADDEASLVDAFFEAESADPETENLFVRLDLPFDSKEQHGFELAKAVTDFYAQLGPAFAEVGAAADWRPPKPLPRDEGGVETLYQTAMSLQEHYAMLFARTVLVLAPTRIANAGLYALWVGGLAMAMRQSAVRVIALDVRAAPMLKRVAEVHRKLVHYVPAELKADTMLEEIAIAAGNLDKPQGRFRLMFVQLGQLIGKGKMDEAAELASRAAALATEHEWFHLACVSMFSLAAGLMGRGDHVRAVHQFRAAEKSAIAGYEKGQAGSLGLRIKTRLSMGTSLLLAPVPAQAAQCFRETAPMAEEEGDKLLLLECWRLASYAHEAESAWDKAWEAGMNALRVGQDMEPQPREASTLPWVGEGLLRITQQRKYASYRDGIDVQMKKLLGDDWRELAKARDVPLDPAEAERMTLQEPA